MNLHHMKTKMIKSGLFHQGSKKRYSYKASSRTIQEQTGGGCTLAIRP
jgi:hypothetical protein